MFCQLSGGKYLHMMNILVSTDLLHFLLFLIYIIQSINFIV